MMRYIPTSGQATAQALSDALWALARPPQVRQPQDTQRLFGAVTMTDGSVWLAVDTAFTIRVHEAAVLGGIAPILQPWIDDGLLPYDTNEELEALIVSLRGQPLVVYEAFPRLFKDQSQTQEQLMEAGLWPVPEAMI